MTDLTRERLAELRGFLERQWPGALVECDGAGIDLLEFFDHTIVPELERLSPASGGVSGEDGGLIARTREIIADAPLGFHEDAPELQLIRNAETLCARLSALLAERDGLKQKIDALEAEVATESYSRGKDEEELSTSSAALAKALGLLREFPASGYQGAPGVRALIKAFLAKHGHQNWDGAWS